MKITNNTYCDMERHGKDMEIFERFSLVDDHLVFFFGASFY